MGTVKIVAITQPIISRDDKNEECMNVEEFVAYVARVSNPNNQNNHLTAPKLLKYLAKNAHWSPMEMVSIVQEINTTRDIARQILRHRSFSFQEFCLTGDSLITTIIPSTGLPNYVTIKKLFERQQWKNYKNILLRVYDEENKIFKTASFREIFYTGIKPIFEITLEDGKKLKCTKNEKFFTIDGKYQILEDIVGLEVMASNKAVMTKEGYIGVNGDICYQNYKWLKSIRNEVPKKSLSEIAEISGVSTHTIRKWLRIHNLQYTKKEVSEYTTIWNKGKFGYKTSLKHSHKHIDAIKKARSGPNCNWWKGGVERSERLKIADWCQTIRKRKLDEYFFSCKECGSHKRLELDHIVPVYQDINLVYNYDNIQVLCHECHTLKHDIKERRGWQNKSKGNILVPRFEKIIKIEYVGEEDTYDIEVEHSSHNFIANKIMVHNSQRYADPTQMRFVKREARLQDSNNRQNSIKTKDYGLMAEWEREQNRILDLVQSSYKWAIEQGIAKEQARAILPEGLTPSRLYMNGTLRSWLHYTHERTKTNALRQPMAQREHRDLAIQAWDNILEYFPSMSDLINIDRNI